MIAHGFTGSPTRAGVARVGVVGPWAGVKRESSPPGTTQNSVLEFAVILHDGSGDVAWTNVSLKPVAAKPRFHIRPPQYVPPELIEFVRERVQRRASTV
jgi:hypothetical protein